jgi:hypothetical protein
MWNFRIEITQVRNFQLRKFANVQMYIGEISKLKLITHEKIFNCEKTLVYKSTFGKIQKWNYSFEKISTVKNHNCTNVHMWNFTMEINHMKNLTLCNLTNVQKYISEISQWKIIIWKISHYKKSLVYKSTCVKFHKWNLLKWEISLPSTTVDCSSAEKGKGIMGV